MEERHVFRIVIYAMFVLFGFDHGCHSMKMVGKTHSCCIMCTFCISDATRAGSHGTFGESCQEMVWQGFEERLELSERESKR
jgi:hypothetical protein